MALLTDDINIFIWRAWSKVATLGDDILDKESKGQDFSGDVTLIQKLCASIQVLQNPPDSMTSEDIKKLISNMYGLGELLELPVPTFNNIGSITNIIQGAYFIAGPVGPQGPAGPTGATGATGPAGADGTDGIDGEDGWTAVYALVADGSRIVVKVVDWTGGTGTKPSINVYVSPSGFTVSIAAAVDIRGPIGATGAAGQQGPAGANGASAYIYVAYASDAIGTDFSLTPSSLLEWIAFKPSAVQIPTPGPSDFTGLWINYKGAQGDPFTFNAIGPASAQSTYDNEALGFTFLNEDTGEWYIKRTSASADWAGPFQLGPQGWSPSLAIAEDNERRVFQLVGYVGGQGVEPTDHVGEYLGVSGYVTDIADAVDIRGPQGQRFFPDASDTLANRTTYDAEPKDFIFYATDNGLVYIKLSDTSGDWSSGFQWRGNTGPTGSPGSPGAGFSEDVNFATTADLDATYSGGGQTLTANSNGVLTVDGLTPGVNERGLVKNESTGDDNGIYIVTDPGSVSTPFILTRASDFNTTLEAQKFLAVFVLAGTANGGTEWTMTTTRSTLVLDSTALAFDSINGIGSGGIFLKLDGTNVMLADLNVGGKSLRNVDGINDISDVPAIYTSSRGLRPSDSATVMVNWNSQAQGLVIATSDSGFSAHIYTDNLLADANWFFPSGVPSDNFVGVSASQTLTNKTLSVPVINVGSDATGDIYYRTALGAFARLGIGSAGDILTVAAGIPSWTATSFNDSTFFVYNNGDNTKKLAFQVSGVSTGTTRTLTIPNVDGTIITTGDTGTVTNTMLAGSIAYSKLSLTGSIINADLVNSSITINGSSVALGASTTVTANVTNALSVDNSSLQLDSGTTFNGSAARTISVKAAGITNAMLAGSIDLTTKVTGVLPLANGGTALSTVAAGSILAANSADVLSAITSTSGLKVLQNNAGTISWASSTGTGNAVFATSPTITTPIIASISDANGSAYLDVSSTASAVNYFRITNAALGGTIKFSAVGTSAAIPITFESKGTGAIAFSSTATSMNFFGQTSTGVFQVAFINQAVANTSNRTSINFACFNSSSASVGPIIRGGMTATTAGSETTKLEFLTRTTGGADTIQLTLTGAELTLTDGIAIGVGATNGTIFGGSTSKIGMFGVAAAIQQATGATLTNNVTSGGTANQVDNYTDLIIYANDAAAIRNNIYQLSAKLRTMEAALKTLGAIKT